VATVIVATAAVSALGSSAASAASTPAPAAPTAPQVTVPQVTVPPLTLPQISLLLHNLLGTVDGLIGDSLGVRTQAEIDSNKDKPVLGKTIDNLTKTTKELPLLGGVVGGVTDDLGLSEPAKTASHPSVPQTVTPATPTKSGGKHRRVEQAASVGSTWTTPMEQAPEAAPVVRETSKPSGGLSGLASDIRNIFPSNAAEAAAAGAGAATVALIVLGGIAVTGAAGAASAAGRRGLVSPSGGGSR
jgi:hypothetical protein